jgi:hypothetical protein
VILVGSESEPQERGRDKSGTIGQHRRETPGSVPECRMVLSANVLPRDPMLGDGSELNATGCGRHMLRRLEAKQHEGGLQ